MTDRDLHRIRARELGEMAARVIIELAADADDAVAVRASRALLDRAHGKARRRISMVASSEAAFLDDLAMKMGLTSDE